MMKKLMVSLAGLGLVLILLAGSFENCSAEEKDSVSQKYPLLNDYFRELSLRANSDNNWFYIEPEPVKPGKVAGEVLLGGFGSVLGGVGGGIIGYSIGHQETSGFLEFDMGGFVGALVGYLIGSNLGCATGVYLVGNSGGERGSYLATFGGSLGGTLVGGLVATELIRNSDNEDGSFPLFLLTLAQAGGATIGFNSSRKKKSEGHSEALLNLKNGNLSLAFPEVDIFQDNLGSDNYKIDLFKAKF